MATSADPPFLLLLPLLLLLVVSLHMTATRS
jgi:hypothetical protein